jgi:hypothetical protein
MSASDFQIEASASPYIYAPLGNLTGDKLDSVSASAIHCAETRHVTIGAEGQIYLGQNRGRLVDSYKILCSKRNP